LTIEVLVADDSAYLRKNIADILKDHESINIVDFAKNGKEAVDLVKKHSPDVLILDLVMPEMNGIDSLKLIMEEHPVPTVILSAINPKNLDSSIQALLMGAFDYIIKPGGIGAKDLPRFREELLAKVLLASQSQIKKIFRNEEKFSSKSTSLRQEIVNQIFDFGQYLNKLQPIQEVEEEREFDSFETMKVKAVLKAEFDNKVGQKLSEDIEAKSAIGVPTSEKLEKSISSPKMVPTKKQNIKTSSYLQKPATISQYNIHDLTIVKGTILNSNIIVMGASVGGPRTITTILKELPRSFPAPILLVQHLSSHFTDAFADNLNLECDMQIKVANNREYLQNGIVYIAPGEHHMELSVENKKPFIKIYKGKPVNFCMPSIDVLFFSAAKIYGYRTLGVLLTGMGSDGVNGLGAIQKLGGKTIAESEETCILYAMPKFAKENGFADLILPNYSIAQNIIEFVNKK